MTEVKFYDQADDSLLSFAVIFARHNNQWIFCRHRDRDTLEFPGGHRETGETIDAAAGRELREETGAIDFSIRPVCIYSVTSPDSFDGKESFGMLYFAEIDSFERELHSEIAEIFFMDTFPDNWTYPEIQPKLIGEIQRRGLGLKY